MTDGGKAEEITRLLRLSPKLVAAYPGLRAAAWQAEATGARAELPALRDAARDGRNAERAANMSRFFRRVGTNGGSPVEFQIRKVREGSMDYSRRNALIDLLLYVEVRTGLIVGLHDASRLPLPIVFGIGSEAQSGSFLHISQREQLVKPAEPALIAAGQSIATLIHGPDRGTRITDATSQVWGVAFSAPGDDPGALAEAVELACAEGELRGLWRVRQRDPVT